MRCGVLAHGFSRFRCTDCKFERLVPLSCKGRPGRQVFVVWDNLNIHLDGKDQRWSAFNQRGGGRFRFVYTPIHASWVNQIEIWFSILQRRVLRHGSFDSVRMLRDHVLGFIADWNRFDAINSTSAQSRVS
jgi:transposase